MSAAATAGAGAAAKNDEVVRHFVIPVPGSDESIVVASNELPADSAEVVEVLRSVSAPVSCWLDLLGAYWRQAAALPPSVSDKEDGPRAQYEKLLRAALSMDSRIIGDPAQLEDRIKLYVATASYELVHGSGATRSRIEASAREYGGRAPIGSDALARYKAAESFIDPLKTMMSRAGAGMSGAPGGQALAAAAMASADLYKYSLLKAQAAAAAASSMGGGSSAAAAAVTQEDVIAQWNSFVSSVRTLGESVHKAKGGEAGAAAAVGRIPLALGEAIVAFEQKDYITARERFAEVITKNPHCGAGPRVGLGLSLYKLGHIEPAKAAFRRALQLDQHNPHALAGLAFLEAHGHEIAMAAGTMGSEEVAKWDGDASSKAKARAVSLLKRSVQLAPDHAQSLLELSGHSFNTWAEMHDTVSGEPITATVTRGSRRLVLSQPAGGADPSSILSRFRANETLKILVRVKGKPIMVPVRLAAREHASVMDAASLGVSNAWIAEGATGLAVLTCRQPWAMPSAAGLTVHSVDLAMAEKQARQAVLATKSDALRADAYHSLARALHAGGNFVDAAIAYRNCLKLNKDHLAALTGIAQCEAQKGNLDEAVKHLRRVLSVRPDDRSALKLLAAISTRQGQYDSATECARRAAELAPWDTVAAALYATLLQRQESKVAVERALRANEGAAARLRETGCAVPVALQVNVGVLQLRLAGYIAKHADRQAEYKKAEDSFHRALHQAASELFPGAAKEVLASAEVQDKAGLSPLGVTATYNLARLRELQGRADEAAVMYQRILAAHPSYLDCHLRLAMIAKGRGDAAAATVHLTEVVSKGPTLATGTSAAAVAARSAVVTALILQGQVLEGAGDVAGAREKYRAALREPGFDADPYAMLSLANLDFTSVYTASAEEGSAAASGKAGKAGAAAAAAANESEREECLRRCFEQYKEVLKRHARNVYAANGLGTVLAEQGRLEHAREVFALVREAAQDCAPVYLNLAHTEVALGRTEAAVQQYNQVLKRFGGGRGTGIGGNADAGGAGGAAASAGSVGTAEEQARILLLMARANVEGRRFTEAIKALMRAIALCPWNLLLQYNLAYTQGEQGVQIANEFNNEQAALEAKEAEKARGAAAGGDGGKAAAAPRVVATITADKLQHAVDLLKASLKSFHWLAEQLDARKAAVAAAEKRQATLTAEADSTPSDISAAATALARARADLADLGFTREQVANYITTMESRNIVSAVEGLLAQAKLKSAEAQKAMAMRAAALAARRRTQEEEEAARAEEEARRREAQRADAAALRETLEQRKVQWKTQTLSSGAEGGKKGGKKGAKAAAAIAEAGGEGDDDDRGSVSSSSSSDSDSSSGSSSSSSSSDSDAAAAVRAHTNKALADLFGEGEDDGEGAAAAATTAELAGNAIIDDLFGDDDAGASATAAAAAATTTTTADLFGDDDEEEDTAAASKGKARSKLRRGGAGAGSGSEDEGAGGGGGSGSGGAAAASPAPGLAGRKRKAAVIEEDEDDEEESAKRARTGEA